MCSINILNTDEFPLRGTWGRASRFDGPETREDDFQVLVRGHWVEFAHKQHVLRGRHVRVGEVADLRDGVTQERRHAAFWYVPWRLSARFFYIPSPAGWPESWPPSPSASPPAPLLLSRPHRRSLPLLRCGRSAEHTRQIKLCSHRLWTCGVSWAWTSCSES